MATATKTKAIKSKSKAKPKTKAVKQQPTVQTPAPTRTVFKIGRPRAYEDQEIDIFNENMENYFNNLAPGEPPTINGLALGLGFVDKWSLYEYQERPVFTASIKKARTMIEKHHESRMSGTQQVTGSIFVLKNLAGWKEQSEQTVITKEYKIEI